MFCFDKIKHSVLKKMGLCVTVFGGYDKQFGVLNYYEKRKRCFIWLFWSIHSEMQERCNNLFLPLTSRNKLLEAQLFKVKELVNYIDGPNHFVLIPRGIKTII